MVILDDSGTMVFEKMPDDASSLENQIAALPEFKVAYEATDQEDFERDLEAGLEINAPDQ